MTLSYIVLVNPIVLGTTGMDPGAVLVATALAAGLATAAAGIFARLPVALAPGMGLNFFFAFTLCAPVAAGGYGLTWQQALAASFLAGVLFLGATVFHLRSRLIRTVPAPLRSAIVAGIGLMIAVIGLRWAGILVATPGSYIGLGDLSAPPVVAALVGLGVGAIAVVRKIPGALILGAGASAAVAAGLGLTTFTGVVSAPASLAPTFLALDLGGLFAAPTWVTAIIILLLVDMFDTVGTLVGVGTRAGLMRDGRMEGAEAAFAADAGGTVAGSLLGTSTVTTYIESVAGIAAGGRTGFAALVTGALLLLCVFLNPLLSLVGGTPLGDETIYPVVAPVLILVGVFMMPQIRDIAWDRPLVAIPAFVTVAGMPLTTSITTGVSAGFIAWSALHVAAGKGKQVSLAVHALAVVFLVLMLLE